MNDQSLLPAKVSEPQLLPTEFTAFGSINHFEAAQRMAKCLYSSSIVPEAYRGEQRLGDCVIALEIANRIGANVLAVMQNLYIVHGRPAWSSQFLIACVNASRRFSPLRYEMTEKGEPKEITYSYNTYVNGQKVRKEGKETVVPQGCIAWAQDKSGEKLESPMVTIDMAVKEGWYTKDGSKWRTMPELMLRYRAATLFARLYAPELTMGIQSADEVEDIIDIAPIVTDPAIPKQLQEGEKTRKPKFTKAAQSAIEIPPPAPTESDGDLAPQSQAPEPSATPETSPAPEPTTLPAPKSPTSGHETPELTNLRAVMASIGVTETQLIAFCKDQKIAQPAQTKLNELSTSKHTNLAVAIGNPKSALAMKLWEFVKAKES